MMQAAPLARIGTGRTADVLAAGDSALKLYAPWIDRSHAFAEAAKQAIAVERGAPAPEVRGVRIHDGRWGVLMARCEGPTLAERMRAPDADLPPLAAGMAALHLRIHRLDGARLPSQRARIRRAIADAPRLQTSEKQALIHSLDGLGPENDRLCHGDFHPENILGPIGAPVVIDWVDATAGEPAADVCRTHLLISTVDGNLAALYLDSYVEASGTNRATILQWQPYLAAARLREGVMSEEDALLRLVRTHTRVPTQREPEKREDHP